MPGRGGSKALESEPGRRCRDPVRCVVWMLLAGLLIPAALAVLVVGGAGLAYGAVAGVIDRREAPRTAGARRDPAGRAQARPHVRVVRDVRSPARW